MRLFVAVDLPDEARQAIAVHQKLLAGPLSKSKEGLKLVEPSRMHLTLLFIGEAQEARVPAIVESMNAPASMPPFDVTFGGVGVFPPRGAAHVLWLGITEGGDQLARLQHDIAERVRELDIEFDDRPFHPHLTLGRWRGADRRRPSADGAARRTAAARGCRARPIRSDRVRQGHARDDPEPAVFVRTGLHGAGAC
jgi:2'-5' RNA ligase